jgi:Flp pilus assembly protein TadD
MIVKTTKQTKQERQSSISKIVDANSYNPLEYAYSRATAYIVNGVAHQRHIVMSDL